MYTLTTSRFIAENRKGSQMALVIRQPWLYEDAAKLPGPFFALSLAGQFVMWGERSVRALSRYRNPVRLRFASGVEANRDHHNSHDPAASETKAGAARAAARILVVEDESIVALDIRNTLRRLGYQVVGVADTGHEAVSCAADKRPDVVLMDIRLRGSMDGIEAAAAIKSRFKIPVIFLTAQADEATRKRADQIAPIGYLIKPFAKQELEDLLASLFEAKN